MGVHFDATFFTGNPYGTIGLGLTPRTAMPNTSTTVSQVTFTYGYGADETAVGVTAGPVNVTFQAYIGQKHGMPMSSTDNYYHTFECRILVIFLVSLLIFIVSFLMKTSLKE